MEDARQVVVAEAAVGALEAREGARARVGVDVLPCGDDGGDEVEDGGELELAIGDDEVDERICLWW